LSSPQPALLLAVVVIATLTACAANPASSSSQQAPTPPAATSPGEAPTATPATEQAPVDDADPTAGATPTAPDPASAAAAFARTDLAQRAWWAGVSGYFTPAAAAIYASTDVTLVPVHQITEGSAQLLPGSTGYRALVAVGTDAGTYTVTLIRAGTDWLVERTEPQP
jgi:hypothetical protein